MVVHVFLHSYVLVYIESGEATLSSKASPRCGCKTKGLCTRSEITHTMAQKTFCYDEEMASL